MRRIARSDGTTCRDVRRRLLKVGYDGIRVEYHDGGAVEYVAFSNRNISATMPVKRFSNLCALKSSSASLPYSRQRWEEEIAWRHKKVKKLMSYLLILSTRVMEVFYA